MGKNMNLFKFSRLGNQAFVKTLVENSGMNALIALVQELTEVMQLQQFHPLLDQLTSQLPAYVHTATQHEGEFNFHPFIQPSTVQDVQVCKHIQHEVGLGILQFWVYPLWVHLSCTSYPWHPHQQLWNVSSACLETSSTSRCLTQRKTTLKLP